MLVLRQSEARARFLPWGRETRRHMRAVPRNQAAVLCKFRQPSPSNTSANNKQKGNANSNGTPPTTQRCTACHEERPIEDFDATATHSRKCRRCRGEGRPVAPAPNTSPRRVSKQSQMPQEPGKTRCSGCGKAQENRLFFNYKYNPPHKRSTCSPCRQRKQETGRRKRERREVEE
jgi:hypothetical protein